MKDLKHELEQLNLSPNEASVYLALLKIGQTSAGKIIGDTRLHRSVVYETLEKLIDRKLVFKLDKKKIAYFQATSPERILQDIKNQEILAKEIIPHLKSLVDANLPEIKVYEGLESYRQFWLESVEKMPIGSTDYVAGTILSKFREYMGASLKKYMKTKIKRRIIWKTLVFSRDELDLELKNKYSKLDSYRLLEKPFTKEGNFNIFGDESVILHSVAEPMIIEIKSKSQVKVFRNLFDILWDSGKDI